MRIWCFSFFARSRPCSQAERQQGQETARQDGRACHGAQVGVGQAEALGGEEASQQGSRQPGQSPPPDGPRPLEAALAANGLRSPSQNNTNRPTSSSTSGSAGHLDPGERYPHKRQATMIDSHSPAPPQAARRRRRSSRGSQSTSGLIVDRGVLANGGEPLVARGVRGDGPDEELDQAAERLIRVDLPQRGGGPAMADGSGCAPVAVQLQPAAEDQPGAGHQRQAEAESHEEG